MAMDGNGLRNGLRLFVGESQLDRRRARQEQGAGAGAGREEPTHRVLKAQMRVAFPGACAQRRCLAMHAETVDAVAGRPPVKRDVD